MKMPEFEGQVCKIRNPFTDENPDDVYIITEDPASFSEDDNIYVVNLNDLQRNIDHPLMCQQMSIAKNELIVIADNLQDYIKSWNEVN
ncbi:hypothetical protein [Mucilaginibacter sp.]|uniref:hypothetical protein n=1 Tax=Mucilaginibacter sp. TaxID=1882438 RepID=UPI002CE104D0|nr:hypothetical protein [Mucilaginibacter sp.]HTI58978.1 hypothetical protein [Mucilaginibacter sp.]